MAKSKSRRRKSSGSGGLQWGGAFPEKKRRRGTMIWALLAVAAAVAAGAYGWNWFTTARTLDAFVAGGQPAEQFGDTPNRGARRSRAGC